MIEIPYQDTKVNFLLNEGTWLAGGALRSAYDKTPIQDYDLFFSDADYMAVADSKLNGKSGVKEIYRCPKNELITYAVELSTFNQIDSAFGRLLQRRDEIKIQLIGKWFYSKPEDIMDDFDINACRLIQNNTKAYAASPECINTARNKKITFHKIKFPAAAFKRIMKYRNKGYTIDSDAILDFLSKIQGNLDQTLYID
jgi:hypothetical protein